MSSSAEIRILPRGPTEQTRHLTVSFAFPYDVGIIEALKRIPLRERSYDEQTHLWYTTQEHLSLIEALARRCDQAMLIDGERWLNLITGAEYRQATLFDEDI